ncbi:MAG TPA: hypothetical protein VFY63_06395 [Pseudorhizobium sp.]|nr:hypothetical protein [Pseudorhizobium sp.]
MGSAQATPGTAMAKQTAAADTDARIFLASVFIISSRYWALPRTQLKTNHSLLRQGVNQFLFTSLQINTGIPDHIGRNLYI